MASSNSAASCSSVETLVVSERAALLPPVRRLSTVSSISMPAIRTKPPSGSARMLYSVCPSWNTRTSRLPKPMANSSTRILNILAARKWPEFVEEDQNTENDDKGSDVL
jgi:hypothetical protein